MNNLIETISDFGNQTGFYKKMANEIENRELLNDNDIHELVCRLEAFIDQEIQELRDENWHDYNSEDEEEY